MHRGGMSADQSASFQRMSQKLKQFMAIVQDDKDVDNIVGFTGMAETMTPEVPTVLPTIVSWKAGS